MSIMRWIMSMGFVQSFLRPVGKRLHHRLQQAVLVVVAGELPHEDAAQARSSPSARGCR
jgi:hypothetical protein